MAQVHLRGVKKSYEKLEVIHGVDIEIADGEFIVIPSAWRGSKGRRRDHLVSKRNSN